jgi:hypothetical protein
VGAAKSLGVVQAVGEHEAAFGVGVDDLDRLAGHCGEDVARFVGAAVGHVFRGADDADDLDGLGLSRAMACMAPIIAAAPAMSYFIFSMPSAGLMEMPPVSKVMPLPTKAHNRSTGCGRGCGLVGHDDEGRWLS